MTLARTFIIRGPEQARALHAFLKANAAALAEQGRPLAVEVREHKAKRSGQQNRRYWAVLRFISENAFVAGRQFSDDAWHEHFRRQFIGCEDLPDGSTVGISTTTLDVGAFNDYMARVEAYAATDLGLDMTEFT
jgi:hypothetical protein